MYVCMYVCVYICTYLCMCVCTYVCLHGWMHICMYIFMSIDNVKIFSIHDAIHDGIFSRNVMPYLGELLTNAEIIFIDHENRHKRWLDYKNGMGLMGRPQHVEEYVYMAPEPTCDIKSTQSLCENPRCGICGIANNGIQLEHHGIKLPAHEDDINSQEFGIYLFSRPQRIYRYAPLIVCDVLPGRQNISYDYNSKLVGFDSIITRGCPSPVIHIGVNSAQIYIFDPTAILPKYIILYN